MVTVYIIKMQGHTQWNTRTQCASGRYRDTRTHSKTYGHSVHREDTGKHTHSETRGHSVHQEGTGTHTQHSETRLDLWLLVTTVWLTPWALRAVLWPFKPKCGAELQCCETFNCCALLSLERQGWFWPGSGWESALLTGSQVRLLLPVHHTGWWGYSMSPGVLFSSNILECVLAANLGVYCGVLKSQANLYFYLWSDLLIANIC